MLLDFIYTHQKSLPTLDGEIVDPEITVKLEMLHVFPIFIGF